MTEQEARKKWCPHALLTDGGMMYNRNALAPDVLQNGANCIASDCMMWVADRGPARVDGVEYDSVAYDTGDCGLKRGLRE